MALKLRYYFFDLDDNLLRTDTKINLKNGDEYVDLSTEEYATISEDKNHNFTFHEDSFKEFSDNGTRGDMAFHQDATIALNEKRFSASFNDLIRCIKNGHLFGIVTARAHHPDTIKKWFYMFINHYLNEDEMKVLIMKLNKYCKILGTNIPKDPILHYLDHCYFFPVTNPELKLPKKIDEAKSLVVEKIVSEIYDYYQTISSLVDKVQIGFSDDNISNVEKMKSLFTEFKDKYKPIKFYIFDTSKGIKIKYKIK
jgi:hypothetical protein